MSNTAERVINTLRGVLPKAIRDKAITPNSVLSELGMDSLAFLEFLLALESEFGLNLSGDTLKLRAVRSVNDAVELVELARKDQ